MIALDFQAELLGETCQALDGGILHLHPEHIDFLITNNGVEMNYQQAREAFASIMRDWHVGDQDAAALFGDDQQKYRVECLLEIRKVLHVLYNDKLAEQWIQLPNTGLLFEGERPLDYMIAGGLRAMLTVRDELLGRIQGHYT